MPIFDQGYQHWSGQLSGHAMRWLAVTRHGVRSLSKGRMIRMLMLMAWLPAVVLVAFLALWGLLEQRSETVLAFLRNILPAQVVAEPQQFRSAIWTVAYSFFFYFELTASLLLVMVVGPGLVSRDLRFNALPLYFSRPLRRFDYFVGKLGVIAFFVAAVAILPAVAAYLIGLAFSLDLGVIRDTHRLLWGSVLYGLMIVISAGTLMLALSSLSRRSIYVGLAWAGFCLFTYMLGGILVGLNMHSQIRGKVDEGVERWVKMNPPPPGVRMRRSYPIGSRVVIQDGAKSPETLAAEAWEKEWHEEYNRLESAAEAVLFESRRNDWRPLVSYTSNLTRIGDWLLDTDTAWVTFGRTMEGARRTIGGAARMHSGGPLPAELTRPANERVLADVMVLQYPVLWSVAVLAGLVMFSILILMTRVKSLDRLK